MISIKSQAIQQALSGNWKEAILKNKDLLKDDPTDIDALNRLAFAFSILGKTKDAKSTYQKVLELDQLNSLAIRNLKKLDDKKNTLQKPSSNGHLVNNSFIEEQGKTKIVELVNIAPSSTINTLQTGQSLRLSIKRAKIFVLDSDNKYMGVLPDDIGKRLIKFITAGNQYDAFVKHALGNHLIIFLREIKKISRFKDQPSFLSSSEKSLTLTKSPRKRKSKS